MLDKPTGLLLVSGPTGSGKSTSLYAFLSKLNTGKHHIITVEDPIEHELQGLTQIQVQPKIGLTFAAGLRSILRHDPDIIMVGEIRDEETAGLAIRAALTGHLVLATIHTNDASSGITRLIDLGIEPFLLCSTLSGILSQRLIRLLCRQCRKPTKIDGAALGAMGLNIPAEAASAKIWSSQGCHQCRMTGYEGRTGVFELLVVDHRIRSLMIKRTSAVQIRQSAMAQGMRSLWQSGWQKIQAGHTSLEELVRVLPPSLQ
jgi:type II secretory ATPase GspE/PulE/Tfp pilus assembly ATPase PilB-like protein